MGLLSLLVNLYCTSLSQTPEKEDLVMSSFLIDKQGENKMDMEDVSSQDSLVTVPMAGGDSPYSYANNSTYQRGGVDSVKVLISEEIVKKLDLKQLLSSSNVFNIADLGCSIGPNTFAAADSIIRAVESKRRSEGRSSEIIEYQVYFNSMITLQMILTLFSGPCLGRERDFTLQQASQGKTIFPKASLNFVNCSYALQWLSKVPQHSPEIGLKRNIHVGNKGVEEYADPFASDMELFLKLRVEEIVTGGFVALLISGIPRGAKPENCESVASSDLLVSCLADMAKAGTLKQAKVDSFRIPLHLASPEEIEEIAGRSRYFKIERIEQSARSMRRVPVHAQVLATRSSVGRLIAEHFGNEIVDEVFNLLEEKLLKFYQFPDPSILPPFDLFLFLERVNVRLNRLRPPNMLKKLSLAPSKQ